MKILSKFLALWINFCCKKSRTKICDEYILVAYVWVIKAQTRMKMNIKKFSSSILLLLIWFHKYDTLYEWWVQGINMYLIFLIYFVCVCEWVCCLKTHKFEWIKWRHFQYLPPLEQEFLLLFLLYKNSCK